MEIIIFILKNFLLPFWQVILNLLSNDTLIGVLIGGVISYFVSSKLLNEKNEIEAKATLKAILAEIKTLELIFKTEFGPKIENNKEIYWYKMPLCTDYFSIYHSNTSQIGKIKNNELRESIIQTYTTLKFFLDCFETNNNILQEYSKTFEFSSIIKAKELMNGDINALQDTVKEAAEAIKNRLKASKKDNILPTYVKLTELFKKISELTIS